MMLEAGERQTTLEQQHQMIQLFIHDPSRVMFVISTGTDILGFIVGVGHGANRNRHSMHLVMGVRQAETGKGYGTQLMQHLEVWAKSRFCPYLKMLH